MSATVKQQSAFGAALRGIGRYLWAERPDKGNRYVGLALAVGGCLSVAALTGIAVDAGWHRLWAALTGAKWLYLLMVPVAVAVSHVGYTVAFRQVARHRNGPRLSLDEALHITNSGFGPVSPRGAMARDTRELCRRGVDRDDAELRVRALTMLESGILAVAAFASAIYMMVAGMTAQAGLLPSWVIGVPAGTVVAALLLGKYRREDRPASWWKPLRRSLDALEALLDLLRSGKDAPLMLTGMIVYQGCEIVALGGSLVVFAHHRGAVPVMVVGYATGYILTRRTLPLAGAGVVEALMPFALSWVGFPLASSVLAVIFYRLFNLWFAMAPAATALRRLDAAQPG